MATITLLEDKPSACGHVHVTAIVDGDSKRSFVFLDQEFLDPPTDEDLRTYIRVHAHFAGAKTLPELRAELSAGLVVSKDEKAP